MPSARPSSCELIPFFEFAMSQTAGSHLSSPSGESSKMVPSLTEYCFLQALHFQRRRVVRYEYSVPPQRGHFGPSGQRSFATNSVQTSRSEKYRIASRSVVGSAFSFIKVTLLRRAWGVKS